MSFITFGEFKSLGQEREDRYDLLPYGMLPKIDRSEISTHFSLGSRDGVGSGVVIYEKEFCYVNCQDFDESPRKFLLIKVPDDLMNEFISYAKWWSEDHWMPYYNPSGERLKINRPLRQPAKDREHPIAKAYHIVDTSPVIGWFENWKANV